MLELSRTRVVPSHTGPNRGTRTVARLKAKGDPAELMGLSDPAVAAPRLEFASHGHQRGGQVVEQLGQGDLRV